MSFREANGEEPINTPLHGASASNYLRNVRSLQETTGYEGKTLRAVIYAWLYCSNPTLSLLATAELRKRLMKGFKRPDWMTEDMQKS
jgi:hypothetical protein